MESTFGSCFADLCVQLQEHRARNEELLQALAEYGYESVALNTEITLAKRVQIKPAKDLEKIADTIPCVRRKRSLTVLQRLTVAIDDITLLHALSAPALDSYDIIAVKPTNEKAMQQACCTLSVDLISLDLTQRLPFHLRPPQIKTAIERGVSFEICYSPALRDATARRNTLANALELVKVAKRKNIIVTSQAEKVFDLRAPADVVTLCHLFGLSDDKCKATITTNCRALLLHAVMRRTTARGVVSSTLQTCSQGQQSHGKEGGGRGEQSHGKEGGGRGKRKGKRMREERKPDAQDSLPSPKRKNN